MTISNFNLNFVKSSNVHTNTFHASNRPILQYITTNASVADFRGVRDFAVFYSLYIYIYIQFAARRAATVPFSTGLVASKLEVFFLSGTVRCVHFTSILESPASRFGVLGLHFGGFWTFGAGLWTPLGAFGRWGQILTRFREKCYILLGSLLAPKI